MKNVIWKVTIFIASLWLFSYRLLAQEVGIVYTICGDSVAGYNGDGIPAIMAEINQPHNLCIDYSGNVFIAERSGRIRKISAADSIITTIAGTDSAGFYGDGGLAINALFAQPSDVKTDASGNIYIADQNNFRVRKITVATGIINTIAGNGTSGILGDDGPATAAELTSPAGLYVDNQNNVYIADPGNNNVRRVDGTTGIITTFAGNGVAGYSGDGGLAANASFRKPAGLCADTAGNIYIADFSNLVVRKVNILTDSITTIAGTGIAGHSGDSGLATHAKLYAPEGLYADQMNNLYIAEFGSGVIRFISGATSIIYTIAGTGIPGFSGNGTLATAAQLQPAGVFLDSMFNIYIADYGNNRIRKIAHIKTGIANVLPENAVGIYPNPATDELIIKTEGHTFGSYSICNMLGAIKLQGTITAEVTIVDVKMLPAGMYFVTLARSFTPTLSKREGGVVREFIKE